jgi:D-amino-acid dehydrogenase
MRVAVVGAGIASVSSALHLRCAGLEVSVLDPRPPGTATSFGEDTFAATQYERSIMARLTSGVELAGLVAPPDFSRIRRLIPRALEVLPGLPAQATRQWMDYRPSTPDSLLVIGRSRGSAHVCYAFGHQHLGLTLGPITGRLIAALVSGQQPEFDVLPYRIERF